jgi:WD40 repeat protein/DNA-binding SARP family transcriptional activator
MNYLHIFCFKSFRVSSDKQVSFRFRSLKAQALLAYLVTEVDRPHSRGKLAGLLWPDRSEQTARHNLSQTLFELRQALEDHQASSSFFLTTPQTIQFNPASYYQLDVATFTADIAMTQKHPHVALAACPACLERLQQALALYEGRFLENLSLPDSDLFENWLSAKQLELNNQAIAALTELSAYYESQGAYEQAQHYIQRHLALEPWHEEAHQRFMRLLALKGQRNQALLHYDQLCQILANELSVSPSKESVALYEQIRDGHIGPAARQLQLEAITNGPVNLVTQTHRPGHSILEGYVAPPYPNIDWGEAPDLITFYGREMEQAKLEQWLIKDRCHLVAILGMGGIGKTALAVKVARAGAEHFDCVLWRSLLNAPPLAEILQVSLQFLAPQSALDIPASLDEQMNSFFRYLRLRRCLLILDNVESILQSDRAGHYKPGYEGYGQLIRRFGESDHQSCLLLTSRECPHNIRYLQTSNPALQTLALQGLSPLAGQELLQAFTLIEEEASNADLVQRYSGNPLALKLVALTIQDYFFGDVRAFLNENSLLLDDIRLVLDQQYSRLSSLEAKLMAWLAIEREPVPWQTLAENLAQAPKQHLLLEALQALNRRSLVEHYKTGFGLQNVIMEYITDCLVNRIVSEIGALDNKTDALADLFFNQVALLKAQTKDYVRESQIRLILNPITEQLLGQWGKPALIKRMKAVLDQVRREAPLLPGYLGANILHLLLHLEVDLRGYDFSNLALWEAYLRASQLPQVNFSQADFRRTVFAEQLGMVIQIAYSPDGRYLAATTILGEIYIWRTRDQQLYQVLRTTNTFRITFSLDSQRLVGVGSDKMIRLWEVQTGHCLQICQGHTDGITGRVFYPDGNTLATASRDGTICLWQVDPANHRLTLKQTLRGHTEAVGPLDISPDGSTLVSCGQDRTIRLWDAATGESRGILHAYKDGFPTKLAFSPDGRLLVSSNSHGYLDFWRFPEAKRWGSSLLLEPKSMPHNLAFSPDGQLLACSGVKWLYLWRVNLDDTPPLQLWQVLREGSSVIAGLAFSPDGQLLASGSNDESIKIWEAASGRQHHSFFGPRRGIRSLALTADGSRLAVGAADAAVHIWPLAQPQPEYLAQTLRGPWERVHSVAFSPDGQKLFISSELGGLSVTELETGRQTRLFSTGEGAMGKLALNTSGRWLACAQGTSIYLWELGLQVVLHHLQGHTEVVTGLAFSPTAPLLASTSCDEQTVRLWDLSQLQESAPVVSQLLCRGENWEALAFNPDGRLLAIAGGGREIQLWRLPQQEQVLTLLGHEEWVEVVRFSPDGQLLISAGDDRSLRFWDIEQGQALATIQQAHDGIIYDLALSPDGQRLYSGSTDGTVKVWDMATYRHIQTLRPEKPYQGMKISRVQGLTKAQIEALKVLGAVES